MATSSSTVPFFGHGEEDQNQMNQHHSSIQTSSIVLTHRLSRKSKTNLELKANPGVEVIALSPKTLMATNRFICEVCNKGIQREQNLQLHRKGHNLPWKLKQKIAKEVKQKVYLYPEPTCVHHDLSRALGNLTGIKKHYSRKHGEKKWKCKKCSKKYAIQADWKAHSKTCGTREYRCDFGTLFLRHDSFVTHRGFYDALAQESTKTAPSNLNAIGNHLCVSSNMSLGLSQVGTQISPLQDHKNPSDDALGLSGGVKTRQFDHFLLPTISLSTFQPLQSMPPSTFFMKESNQNYHDENQCQQELLQNKPLYQGLMQLADLPNTISNPSSVVNLFNLSFLFDNNTTSTIPSNNLSNINSNLPSYGLMMSSHFNNHSGITSNSKGSNIFSENVMCNQMNSNVPSLFSTLIHSDNMIANHTSATMLLQRATQMGYSSSNNNAPLLRSSSSSSSSASTNLDRMLIGGNFSGIFNGNNCNLHDLMNSFIYENTSIFCSRHAQAKIYTGYNYENRTSLEHEKQYHGQNTSNINMNEVNLHQHLSANIGGSDRLIRDFLGIGQIMRSISGSGFLQKEKQHHQKHHSKDMGGSSSLDSEKHTNVSKALTSQSNER